MSQFIHDLNNGRYLHNIPSKSNLPHRRRDLNSVPVTETKEKHEHRKPLDVPYVT